MAKIQPPTDVDLRLHALNLAVAQSRDKFRFSDETDQAGETLAMARRYRDWIANGDAQADPEPGHDDSLPVCSGCGGPVTPDEFQIAIENGGILGGSCASAEVARRAVEASR